ncbi:response regulator transcription factor [Microbacterium hydrocarbonoxydans]|uniref:response regulator transcription factor n=1 Tax=Microbacterium hydrocarbonoxydans TaxID=273678 RepID=UPI0013DBD43F|nr:response regulator transcription factor [Microbacterium hydrocarbonoxydans]
MYRIFLVDDHEVVRRGIADLIETQADLTVVGEAATCAEGFAGVARTLPDVAIVDGRLPDGSGIDLSRRIRQQHPGVACLILTAFDDDDALMSAILGDAAGYLLKSVRTAEILTAVRAVAQGRRLLSRSMIRRVGEHAAAAADDDPRFGSLNAREKQILALIAEGLTNRAIGERLGLAEKTIKNYVSSLLGKLGLERRTQAALLQVSHARQASGPHPGSPA